MQQDPLLSWTTQMSDEWVGCKGLHANLMVRDAGGGGGGGGGGGESGRIVKTQGLVGLFGTTPQLTDR